MICQTNLHLNTPSGTPITLPELPPPTRGISLKNKKDSILTHQLTKAIFIFGKKYPFCDEKKVFCGLLGQWYSNGGIHSPTSSAQKNHAIANNLQACGKETPTPIFYASSKSPATAMQCPKALPGKCGRRGAIKDTFSNQHIYSSGWDKPCSLEYSWMVWVHFVSVPHLVLFPQTENYFWICLEWPATPCFLKAFGSFQVLTVELELYENRAAKLPNNFSILTSRNEIRQNALLALPNSTVRKVLAWLVPPVLQSARGSLLE